MNIKKGIVFLISFFVLGSSFAQQSDEVEENPITLNSQFEDLVNKSNSYQNYKVIELNKLQSFKTKMMDSVQALYKEIATDEKIMKEQKQKINKLNSEISQLKEELEEAIAEKDAFLFMGTQIEKSVFRSIFWSVTIGLLLILLFFIFKYFFSQKITVEAKRDLVEAHKELEELRRRHIKKEQEIMRQLQDEINKNLR